MRRGRSPTEGRIACRIWGPESPVSCTVYDLVTFGAGMLHGAVENVGIGWLVRWRLGHV